jgi:hypothetical protein
MSIRGGPLNPRERQSRPSFRPPTASGAYLSNSIQAARQRCRSINSATIAAGMRLRTACRGWRG